MSDRRYGEDLFDYLSRKTVEAIERHREERLEEETRQRIEFWESWRR